MTNPLSSGTRVKALDFPPTQQVQMQVATNNQSNTSFAFVDPEVAVRFLAPTSGRVAVKVGCGLGNNGANADRIIVTWVMYEGDPESGVVFQQADMRRGLSNAATSGEQIQHGGHVTMVDGLTPGTFYYARVVHRTTTGAATADINGRDILVWPIP